MRSVLAALCVAAVLVVPVQAEAVPVHKHVQVTRHRTSEFAAIHSPHAATYKVRVWKVVKYDVPPANADGDKLADTLDSCPDEFALTDDGCVPAPVVNPIPSTQYPDSPAYQPPASSGGCPSYMSGEADSPTDVNPASGAEGCWQVIPSTAALMGAACSDVNSTACLSAICAAQGNEAWAASGSTPCG